ncbi:ABC transporter substrate-binding protein [Agaricicola taiwanensis]|uniref:Putative aliphatic sulfonates-binding protein n=1 Tax=Agaricicola taiwanensis TaxID=591372 RepID=A0A8J3DWV1_9RHOB|nr:aliphatic sulfonate ABC transporter substrate-binding protein [Agaricicola taiwanensis]GGE50438.1 ABC transporter substrate-binding protein [Agaricicola taiwanensis]
MSRIVRNLAVSAAAVAALVSSAVSAFALDELRIDWAFYNPVSLVLKDQKLLEKEFEKDGTTIRWVQSAGSNKALEFLNSGSIDLGSSAGAAALIAKINGNPIKSIYVYSRPEWTALVTSKDSHITKVEDLKGKSVAVTRGTDPHIFLVRALAEHGLTDKDVRFVLLQHADGRLALSRGDVDAWAGLDPMMASAELEEGARLFFRKPEANTWGVLNVREEFAEENPEIVSRVLKVYEEGRKWALDHPKELAELLAKEARIPVEVAEKQLGERTELTHNKIGGPQRESILAAGKALQEAGVIGASADVEESLDALIDDRFSSELTN